MLRRALILLVAAAALPVLPSAAAASPLTFSPPILVDPGLAGGEPLVFADPLHGTLVYTSHEGTTHLYRNGLATTEPAFVTHYRNQVNMWTSTDFGATWKFVDFNGTGFVQNPSQNTGFSDPDLTADAGGRIYNTGIDLVNDALFSTGDGGRTWDRGTIQCHDGDRPWLAGGRPDEVFLATNANAGGHVIVQSTDGGNSCAGVQISDPGGDGKLHYVPDKDMLLEPTLTKDGIGVARWHRGESAFTKGKPAYPKPILAHWPAIAIDANDTVYEVWDTDPRKADGMGCSDASPTNNGATGSPLPNQVQYAYSHDLGQTWSAPITVAAPAGGRAFWPWIAAGDAGRINIVWYQSDKLVDLDCQSSDIHILTSTILGADDDAARQMLTVDPIGRAIHKGGVCQGGTTCVATGQDRRLGDFFTNDVLPNGCVVIASGDTTHKDALTGGELPTSLALFIRQLSGPSLRGTADCDGSALPQPPTAVAATCADRATPTSRFNRHAVIATRRRLALRGVARDTGCRSGSAQVSGSVARVTVSVGRRVGASACRFLRAGGGFGPRTSCRNVRYVRARGTTHWHFDFTGRFPKGAYEVRVRAVDARGNVERTSAQRNVLVVRVR
jgi:hypothetical protein